MKKYVVLSVLLLIGLWFAQPLDNRAQSGRRRPERREPRSTEPEKPRTERPAEKPSAPSGEAAKAAVPAGGEIAKRVLDPKTATMRFRLQNGLTVIVREKYSKPLVAITAYVKAGRLDEPNEAVGVAELVQRLLLQGTTNRPGTRAARELRTLGGVMGARTSYEDTIYYAVLPAEKAVAALEIQADILQHPAVDAAVVRRQAELLAQEYKSQQDDLSTQAFRSMLGLAFPENPPGHLLTPETIKVTTRGFESYIGYSPAPEKIRAITRDQVLDFYRTRYRPDTVILSFVGAVNPFTVMEAIQRAYGGWAGPEAESQTPETTNQKPETRNQQSDASGPLSVVRRPSSVATDNRQQTTDQPPTASNQTLAGGQPPPTPSNQLRYGRQEMEVDPAVLTISYRFDKIETADRAALEILVAVWGRGQFSRLQQELREARPIVLDFATDQIELNNALLLSFQLSTTPENFNQAEIGFFDLAQRLRREILPPGELQRAQSMLERWFYDRRARLQNEAEELARSEATGGDYHEADHYVERVRAVTVEQVQRVAAKYLVLPNVTVYEVLPHRVATAGVTAESFAGWIATQVPGIDKAVAANQVKPASPAPLTPQGQRERPGEETDAVIFSLQPEPIHDYSVLRGSRAYVRVDHGRPTVSVGLFFQGGRLFEDASNNGITELTLRAMLRGAKSKWNPETGAGVERGEEAPLPAQTIAMKLEQLGGEIQLVNEADFFGFILNVLSRNQEPALKLLVDVIERPTFDEGEFTRVRNALLYDLRQQRAQPMELAWQALVGQHPYGLPRLGRPEVLQTLTPEHVRAWRDRTIGQQYPLTVIVGDTDGSILISSVIANQFRRRDTERSFRAVVPTPPAQPQEQVKPDGKQSALAVGFLGPSGKGDEDEVLDVIEHALSGIGGRLTDQLRDESGIACRVQTVFEPRLLVSAFFTSLTLPPENEARAREALEREFNRLASEPISDEELNLGVNSTIGAQSVELEPHSARVLAYARRVFLNQQPAQVENYADRIRTLTKDKIRAVAGQYFKWNQRGVGIVRK
jgi:zinc protease